MQQQLTADKLNEIPWMAQFAPKNSKIDAQDSGVSTANIRAVWLIAKPNCTASLAAALKGPLIGLLQPAPGFEGSIVLRAHNESRSVIVLTFWEKSAQAIHTRWEDFSAVQRLLSPLVDVCTKVQAYEGEVSIPKDHPPSRSMPANPS
jgi:hypothetical protein